MITFENIPTEAVTLIKRVVVEDEGGFSFHDEANGDWNFGGITSAVFHAYPAPILNLTITETKAILTALPIEEQQELCVEIYYNNYFLPLQQHIEKTFGGMKTTIGELSCAINCGLETCMSFMPIGSTVKEFYKAWKEHYVKLVVDNAAAWQKWGNCFTITCGLISKEGVKPVIFRAPNLQGWINRVEKYQFPAIVGQYPSLS